MGSPLQTGRYGRSFGLGDGVSFSRWLDQNPGAWMITDKSGVIEYVNPAFEALTGYSRGETLGRTPAILKSGVQDADFYGRLWRSILAGRPFSGVLVNRRKSGELYHAEDVIWPAYDRNGLIASFVCETRDVSEDVRRIERLEHAATHDPLTDLPNRTVFLDRLDLALRHALRRGEGLAVAMLDLDAFRETNNRYGHLAGDALLHAVARRAARCVREGDTVARMGGDEFAMILPDANEPASVAAVLQKIRAAAAVPIRHHDRLVATTVSIGVSLYPRDGTEGWQLRKCADDALYEAKRAGGGCVRFHRAPV